APPSGGHGVVFALAVQHESRMRPAQKRWDDRAHALARTGRRERANMLGAIVAQVVQAARFRIVVAAAIDALPAFLAGRQKAARLHFLKRRKMGCTVDALIAARASR